MFSILRKLRQFPFILNIHEGDGGGAAAGGDGASTGDAQKPAGEPAAKLAKVVYGKQSDAADGTAEPTTAKKPDDGAQETTKPTFDELINGDYRDDYQKHTEKLVQTRLKNSKEAETTLQAMSPLFETLAAKYGKETTDYAGIIAAVTDDSSLISDLAYEAGMSVDQYKQMRALEAENTKFKQQQEALERAQIDNERRQKVFQAADEVKSVYPQFDLMQELNSDKGILFVKLVDNGLPALNAYAGAYIDEVVPQVASQASARAKQETVASIQNKQARPKENGVSSTPSAIIKDDVSKLSSHDRQEIIRQARMERRQISF
jgi:hypothetical protein